MNIQVVKMCDLGVVRKEKYKLICVSSGWAKQSDDFKVNKDKEYFAKGKRLYAEVKVIYDNLKIYWGRG